jgi:hypothetical protein
VSDNQLIHPEMLGDINDVLNGEEFVDLYSSTEIEHIISSHQTLDNYLQQIKNNLHIILVMNPQHSNFAENIRNYPSLTKNCTINWIN